MFGRLLRLTVVATVSAVAVPYAVALLSNILYGWPLCTNRYKRAFHPKKVLALNYALLLELTKLRFARLYFKWRHFYRNTANKQLIKDCVYSPCGNTLDIYLPSDLTLPLPMGKAPMPLVVFIYGGTWGSGDKDMYGLLCSQLANRLSAVVACPNYSIYPKGFVDDMVEDISDVLVFLCTKATQYGADSKRIALIGHSAGAHLALQTVIELALNKMAGDRTAIVCNEAVVSSLQASDLTVSYIGPEQPNLEFHNRHFSLSGRASPVSSAPAFQPADQSFVDLTKSEIQGAELASSSAEQVIQRQQSEAPGEDSFCILSESDVPGGGELGNTVVSAEAKSEDIQLSEMEQPADENETPEKADVAVPAEVSMDQPGTDASSAENLGQKDIVAEIADVHNRDDNTEGTEVVFRETESTLYDKQHKALSSIRLVIGLAGVYDIEEHYQFEMWRGVEDISTMARAMYGFHQFERLSPTLVLDGLDAVIRFPPVHLIHGSEDATVPVSSSTRFAEVALRHSTNPVTVTVVNGCGHADVCLDLMDPERRYYSAIFSEIIRVFEQHVRQSV